MEKLILRYIKNWICFFKAYALLFVLGFFAFPGNGFAQADTTKKLKEVKISNTALPIVQTATPSQQINASDFKRYSAFNVADAIRDFSGVNIKDYGGIGGLKTISVRSLGADNTGVMYDGILLNDAQNGQIDLGKFSLDNLQQIILFDGQPDDICQPARAFSYASVLVLKPTGPQFEAGKNYNIRAGYKMGSFGLFNPTLSLQQKISRYWSASVSGDWQKANGQYKYKNTLDGSDTLAKRTNDDINSINTDAALYWTKNDSDKFSIRFNYYGSNRGLPGAVINYNPYSAQRLWDNDAFIQSGYDKKWEGGLQLLLRVKASQNFQHYLDSAFPNAQGFLDQQYTQQELYQSAAVAYQFTNALRLSYASDFAITDLHTTLPGYTYPVRYTWLNVLAGSLKLGRFNIQANLLNTHIAETATTGDTPAPRTVYSPTVMFTVAPFAKPNLQLRAFYKDIFRNPTFNDLYYSRIGNISLKPEYTKQFDVGATYAKALTGRFEYLTLTGDVYYNNVTDKIVAVPGKDLFSWTIQNLGKVNIKGADVGLKTQVALTGGWKGALSVNYTYQQALDVTDPTTPITIPYTPQNSLAGNLGVFNKRIGIYYNQVYSSSRFYLDDNSPEYSVPGFTVSDASVNYKFALSGKQTLAGITVNNLFDTPYAIVRSYPMPGRSVRISFQITI